VLAPVLHITSYQNTYTWKEGFDVSLAVLFLMEHLAVDGMIILKKLKRFYYTPRRRLGG
jgi:hypothetical protein